MKIRTKCVAALLFLCGIAAHAQDVTPDKTGMQTTATDWCKQVKMGWNLGNSLESEYSETGWSNPKTTQSMINAVKAAGFNAVRIPVRWTHHFSNASDYTIDKNWLARVKEVVDYCYKNNMYVIINTHHEPWEKNVSTNNLTEIYTIWKQVAAYFRNYDGHLAFAGLNEVIAGGDWERGSASNQKVLDKYNQVFVNAVRETGGKNYYRNLIVQPWACSYMSRDAVVIPEDKVTNHLAVEFHFYQPWDYAGGGSYYFWGQKYSSYGEIPSMDEAGVKTIFDEISNRYVKNGYGVVFGEYGNSDHFTTAIQEENAKYYLNYIVSQMRSHGFAGFVWDNNAFGKGGEKFGIFNRDNNMSVDYALALESIQKGSATNYDASTLTAANGGVPTIGNADINVTTAPSSSTVDLGSDGTVVWTGSDYMNWGTSGQHKIEASAFAKCSSQARVILVYTQDAGAEYQQIQIQRGDWQGNVSFSVDKTDYDGDFKPNEFYGSKSGSRTTSFDFVGESLEIAKNMGLNIQGFGLTLTKIMVVDDQEAQSTTVTIEDGKTYTPQAVSAKVVLKRSFSSSRWNTLVLPFNASKEQLTKAFGEGFQMAALDSYNGNSVNFKSVSQLTANVPVIVKPAKDLTSVSFDVVELKTPTNNLTATTTGSKTASFIGSYANQISLGNDCFFIAADNGKFTRSAGASTLGVTRAYFKFSDVNASTQAKIFTIDGFATSIDNLSLRNETDAAVIYNMNGQKVSSNYKGIVIKNGKKIIVR